MRDLTEKEIMAVNGGNAYTPPLTSNGEGSGAVDLTSYNQTFADQSFSESIIWVFN